MVANAFFASSSTSVLPPRLPGIDRCLSNRTFRLQIDREDDVDRHVRDALPEAVAAIDTNGDGACAIHSVWGTPTLSNELECVKARNLAWEALGESLGSLHLNVLPGFSEDAA